MNDNVIHLGIDQSYSRMETPHRTLEISVVLPKILFSGLAYFLNNPCHDLYSYGTKERGLCFPI